MPEPGSKKYDTRRARKRKEAESDGIPDSRANDEAKARSRRTPSGAARAPGPSAAVAPRGNASRAATEPGAH